MTEKPHEKIFDMLFQEDELTWQNIIYDLVRKEGMNPWDIDISEITFKFIKRLKEFKDMDFRISGKIVLASALMLKMKSNRLLDHDLTNFDSLIAGTEEDSLESMDEMELDQDRPEIPNLVPKTPQPRKRKVSIFDLVEALEKALKSESRRKQYIVPDVKIEPPKKPKDISMIITDVYDKISSFLTKKNENLTFSQLIPSDTKEDKVFTFIPLLHLENQQKIDMTQEEHFGEISILLTNQKR